MRIDFNIKYKNMRDIIDARQVVALVLENLRKGESFFLNRFGDGELLVYFEKYWGSMLYQKKLTDHRVAYEQRFRLKDSLLNSIIMADVLSIPTERHIAKGGRWPDIISLYDSMDLSNKLFCSHDIHFDLIKTGLIDEILSDIERLYIASPRDVSEKLKSKFKNIKEIDFYRLPGQVMFEESDLDKRLMLPDVIDDVVVNIKQKPRKNWLCLFGGGVAGKEIGGSFKQSGGVALDLGSVFDFWVGKVTRGASKGPFVYDNKFLL